VTSAKRKSVILTLLKALSLFLIITLCSLPISVPYLINHSFNELNLNPHTKVSYKIDHLGLNSISIKDIHYESKQDQVSIDLINISLDWWQVYKFRLFKKITVHQVSHNKKTYTPTIQKLIKKGSPSPVKTALSLASFFNEKNELRLPFECPDIKLNHIKLSQNNTQVVIHHAHGKLDKNFSSLNFNGTINKQSIEMQSSLKNGKFNSTLSLLQQFHSILHGKLKADIDFMNNFSFEVQGSIHSKLSQNQSINFNSQGDLEQGLIHLKSSFLPTIEGTWSDNTLKLLYDNQPIGEYTYSKEENKVMAEQRSTTESSLLHWRFNYSPPDIQDAKLYFNSQQFKLGKLDLKNFKFHLLKFQENSTWYLSILADECLYNNITLQELNLQLPLFDPNKSGSLTGQLNLPSIDQVDIESKLFFTPRKFSLSGNLQIDKLSLYDVPVSAFLNWDMEQSTLAEAKINLDDQELNIFTDDFDLFPGNFSSELSGLAELSFDIKKGLQQNLSLHLQEGFFANEDLSTTLSGFECQIQSNDLLNLKTGPAQSLSWNKLSTQGMTFNKGLIYWQWEEEQRLFVESMNMTWCKGTLSLQPIRIDPKKRKADIVLFCEEVQLTDILESFQVGDVEGKGSLGGKISFSIDKDEFQFSDTYLYSDPSTPGNLKVKEAVGLDQAMNQSNLKLARECLKDYDYKWAKLNFINEEDQLLLKLEMDGKPNGLLPFRFDPKTADFIYDSNAPGVDLKGLKLNTNFRSEQFIPLLQSSLKWINKFKP